MDIQSWLMVFAALFCHLSNSKLLLIVLNLLVMIATSRMAHDSSYFLISLSNSQTITQVGIGFFWIWREGL